MEGGGFADGFAVAFDAGVALAEGAAWVEQVEVGLEGIEVAAEGVEALRWGAMEAGGEVVEALAVEVEAVEGTVEGVGVGQVLDALSVGGDQTCEVVVEIAMEAPHHDLDLSSVGHGQFGSH